jgi:hypothetical protein
MNWNRLNLTELLKKGECTVTFTKVNGENRIMRCTLNSFYLPESIRDKGQLLTEANPSVLSVWDLDNNGWRSFRIDSVLSVKEDSSATTAKQMLLG